ncbi:ATP-binding cassette domain-containing protein [Bifidobacterium sp. 64T4]|uniref:ATP-binding cassette domain-containing protein n=1 Tax=Bifidobacterium pongonis TaxID=2834432 RepID=UPI001C568AE3|nr:ATP-binding cassette domain-containing protein [Bifidobacterium pongonis]MBW3095131.1 ATP-binding cassette domain-containing protein [Bifidobacterium pongonis]
MSDATDKTDEIDEIDDKDEAMTTDTTDELNDAAEPETGKDAAEAADTAADADVESIEFSVEYDDVAVDADTADTATAKAAEPGADAAEAPAGASAAATTANANHVEQTLKLSKANGESGKTKTAADRAYAKTNHRLDKQVRDRVLLKSYPTFSLNHVTTTARKTGRHVLDNLSLAFYAGTLYAVKVLSDEDDPEQRTTLMAVMGAFEPPTSGEVMSKSSNFTELELGELRGHRLGLVPQRYAVRGDLDAEGNLLYAMNGSGRGFLKPKPAVARDVLNSVGFSEATKGKKVRELSLLDQRRVAIARALCCDAETVILDEPTKGLDEAESAELLDLLQRIARGRDPKRTVIIITSDDAVAAAAQKVYDLTD